MLESFPADLFPAGKRGECGRFEVGGERRQAGTHGLEVAPPLWRQTAVPLCRLRRQAGVASGG